MAGDTTTRPTVATCPSSRRAGTPLALLGQSQAGTEGQCRRVRVSLSQGRVTQPAVGVAGFVGGDRLRQSSVANRVDGRATVRPGDDGAEANPAAPLQGLAAPGGR